MKNKAMTLLLAAVWLNSSIASDGFVDQASPVGWIDCQEVHGSDDAFSIYTNLGVVPIKVLDYDEESSRFLVECFKYGSDYYPPPDSSLE